ncbi:MAG TPA: YIP1 family protein [Longimicrobiaceae bacterium]|nr:YIP1 family protein [Longimicrobiaceae bacterium]
MSSLAAPRSLGHRVVATFLAPRALFEEIRESAPWAGPLAISVAVGILVLLLLPDEVFVAQAQEAARLSRKGEVTLTSDPGTIAFFERVRIATGMLVVRPILAFLMAGLLALVFSGLLRGRGEYRQYLSVTTHALLITALGTLAALPLQIVRGDAHARLSLALLAPALEPGSLAQRVLQALDPFTLWMMLIAALGVSVVNGSRSPARAAVVLIGGYLAVVLVLAALGP